MLTPESIAREEARQKALMAQQPQRDPNASLWDKFSGKDVVEKPPAIPPVAIPTEIGYERVEPVQQPPPQRQEETPDWIRNLRKETAEKGKQIKDLQEKIADYDTIKTQRDEATKRMEELRKIVDIREKVASVAALEQSDEYQEKFVRAEDTMIESLKTLSSENGLDAEAVMSAVNNPNKIERAQQIAAIWSSMSEFNRDEFKQTVKNIDNLRSNRARALMDAKTELQQAVAKRRQDESEKSAAKTRESRDAWLSASIHAAELGIDDKTLREAEAFWNGARDKVKSALVVLKGFAHDSKDARIKELEDVVRQYQGAQPGLRSGTPPVQNGNGEVTDMNSMLAKLKAGGYSSTRI